MYRYNPQQQNFVEFDLPFGGKLRSDNRWVKLAALIPWESIDAAYRKSLSTNNMGSPAKSSRVAFGALVIKERLGTSDAETVAQIAENPYLQYFLGFEEYRDTPPFNSSMMTHFRKRFSVQEVQKINETLIEKNSTDTEDNTNDSSQPPACDGGDSSGNKNETSSCSNSGKLIVDATCAPADIGYPTDLRLVNDAREKAENIIDKLHAPWVSKKRKPRTYRRKANKVYLNAVKSKKLSTKKRRKAIGKLLNFVQRDLRHIQTLSKTSLSLLSKKEYKDLLVIHELYRQQRILHETKSRSIPDRIVSLSQPHVRPIVRGKAGKKTEFGAKLSVSLCLGHVYLDKLSWSSYNESGDLISQVESYRDRFGCYPSSVHADKIYRTRENRGYCKERGIRLSGPALGRPSKDSIHTQEQKKQQRQDELDRIEIEGKFGVGKRRFSLARVMTKLAHTSQTAIGITFFVLNLEKLLRDIFWSVFQGIITTEYDMRQPIELKCAA